MPIFNKKAKNTAERHLYIGRASEARTSQTEYSPFRTKSTKLLNRLRNTYDVHDAINLLIEQHPDTSMGYAVLQSLVNQGGRIEFSSCSAASSARILREWNEFAERVNAVNSSGLDGLLVQLHGYDFSSGGMGCEVVVNSDCTDIEDVYPIDPRYLKWKLEIRNNKQQWVPYQCVNGKQIDLSKSNFIWIPFNPNGTPCGSLLFAPAIAAADMQLEFLNSSQTVLYRVGCPRYDITLDRESLMKSAPPDVATNPAKAKEYIQQTYDSVKASFANLSAENDIVHTDDTKISTIGGDSSAYFQGISAYADVIDVQMMNAVKTLGTLMNRRSSGSYALSTVEFKVIVDMIEPRQRAEKRLVESIARIWLRVHGYNATVRYTPNPIEWQSMLDKIEFNLKNQEFYRRSDEYGYISPDEAAYKTNGAEKAFAKREGFFAYISKLLSKNDLSGTGGSNSETEGDENN